jgi:N-methylhydantoinase A
MRSAMVTPIRAASSNWSRCGSCWMAWSVVEKPRLESFRPKSSVAAEPVTSRKAFFEETGWVDCPVYQREALAAGQQLSGPAIVVETGSTTVIAPGDRGEIDDLGDIIIQVASRYAVSARQPESAGVLAP